ncbi:hypothetical protein [Streptomyces brasiliensis]|uniref:Uncharacterized protein n=1 Tax=Streptomyces brasiliensis TaxID=1954 RepID=A0A917LAT6_9ACTN|nr:hypothetical protein [Streptomyces brasiliensis]GGJ56180.1 hypothetical protein GCM10010121_078470 [Streptomyces brasiliensis]
MSATWSGIGRDGEWEASSATTEVELFGKAASASAMHLRCTAGRNDSFWTGRQFTSAEQMQAEALTWASGTAGRRQCRPLGGASSWTAAAACGP